MDLQSRIPPGISRSATDFRHLHRQCPAVMSATRVRRVLGTRVPGAETPSISANRETHHVLARARRDSCTLGMLRTATSRIGVATVSRYPICEAGGRPTVEVVSSSAHAGGCAGDRLPEQQTSTLSASVPRCDDLGEFLLGLLWRHGRGHPGPRRADLVTGRAATFRTAHSRRTRGIRRSCRTRRRVRHQIRHTLSGVEVLFLAGRAVGEVDRRD